jgi:dTMP kinase
LATTSAAIRGRFVTFEGGEGTGKSTQVKLLADRLRAANVYTVVTREPGGSAGAEIIRHLVLSGVGKALGADGEALLFAAARDDHVRRVIAPALAAGAWVLCDRFFDSTRVYQGKLGAADLKLIKAMERVTIGNLQPDLTIVLDEDLGFHRKLRDAFRQITVDDPLRCVLVAADADIATVSQRVWAAVTEKLTVTPQTTNLAATGA